MTWVNGIDVSHWQTPGPPPAGTRFGVIKASQGGSRDSKLAAHHAAFTRAGIDRGAYCYYDFDSSPERNAETFLAATAGLAWELPHALDAEDETKGRTSAQTAAELLRFLDLVEAGTGRVPIVYTGSFWWRANVGFDERFARYPLWLARYPNRNATTPPAGFGSTKPPAPWPEITIWQYSDSGGHLDRNAAPAHLYARLLAGTSKPPTTAPGDLTVADIDDILTKLTVIAKDVDDVKRGVLIDEQSDERADHDERARDGSTRALLLAGFEALGVDMAKGSKVRQRAAEIDKADTFKQA